MKKKILLGLIVLVLGIVTYVAVPYNYSISKDGIIIKTLRRGENESSLVRGEVMTDRELNELYYR